MTERGYDTASVGGDEGEGEPNYLPPPWGGTVISPQGKFFPHWAGKAVEFADRRKEGIERLRIQRTRRGENNRFLNSLKLGCFSAFSVVRF
jgi:hypothetical protein